MNIDLAKALIAAGGTIFGAVISAIVKHYLDTKDIPLISPGRRLALQGTWKGNVTQYREDGESMSYPVDITFDPKRKRVTGEAKIHGPSGISYVKLGGAFTYDRFLRMDYENKDRNIIQFGYFLFELHPGGEELTGRFVGYGHFAQGTVHGTAKFIKE